MSLLRDRINNTRRDIMKILLIIAAALFMFSIVSAEEPKVYGDADLKKYDHGNSSIPDNAANSSKRTDIIPKKSGYKKADPSPTQQKRIDYWKSYNENLKR